MPNNSGGEESSQSKRQRVSRACDLCRRKKVKCDGGAPICANCQAFGLECSYNDTTKKRGPPKGYIEAIENRLHKMEALLGGLVQSDDPRALAVLAELNSPLETPTGQQIRSRPLRRSQADRSSSPWHQEGPETKRTNTGPTRSYEARSQTPPHSSPSSSVHSPILADASLTDIRKSPAPADGGLDDGMGQLSIDENGQVRFIGKSSGLYLLQNSRTFQNGTFHFSVRGCRRKNNAASTAASGNRALHVNPEELPPPDLSQHLIQLYFEHFHPFLPLVHKSSFTTSFYTEDQQPPLLLMNALFALASRISSDVRVRSDPDVPETAGDIFFERAKRLLDEDYDASRITTVQALLLMACHQHGVTKPARSWLYSGMAFRMAQDLGLNRDCEKWNLSRAERETRKRVFWCCFVVDRLTSAVYGRSLSIDYRDCDAMYPRDDEYDVDVEKSDQRGNNSEILTNFIHLIKLCEILGRVLQNVYSVKSQLLSASAQNEGVLGILDNALTAWYTHLPLHLQYPPGTANGDAASVPSPAVCQLQMIYYTTIILLHRPFITISNLNVNQPQPPSNFPSQSICTNAANNILDIANGMFAARSIGNVFNFTIYYLLTTGIIFINNASSSDPNTSATGKTNINKLMQLMPELQKTWPAAKRTIKLLDSMSEERELNLDYTRESEAVTKHEVSESKHRTPRTVRGAENSSSPVISFHDRTTASYHPRSRMVMDDPQQRSSALEPMNISPIIEPFVPNPYSNVPEIKSHPHPSNQHSLNLTLSPSMTYQIQQQEGGNTVTWGFTNSNPSTPSFPMMDPFAAPGTVHPPVQRGNATGPFDPLATFWGISSSGGIDMDEWSAYLGNHATATSVASNQMAVTALQSNVLNHRTPFSLHPSSQQSSQQVQHQPSQPLKNLNLTHNDRQVDVLSGVSMSPTGLEDTSALNVYAGEDTYISVSAAAAAAAKQNCGADLSGEAGVLGTTNMIYW